MGPCFRQGDGAWERFQVEGPQVQRLGGRIEAEGFGKPGNHVLSAGNKQREAKAGIAG